MIDHERYRVDPERGFRIGDARTADTYQRAYEDAVDFTSTPWAPRYVVPADHKWYRNLVVARIVCASLEGMDPRWPRPDTEIALEDLEQA